MRCVVLQAMQAPQVSAQIEQASSDPWRPYLFVGVPAFSAVLPSMLKNGRGCPAEVTSRYRYPTNIHVAPSPFSSKTAVSACSCVAAQAQRTMATRRRVCRNPPTRRIRRPLCLRRQTLCDDSEEDEVVLWENNVRGLENPARNVFVIGASRFDANADRSRMLENSTTTVLSSALIDAEAQLP